MKSYLWRITLLGALAVVVGMVVPAREVRAAEGSEWWNWRGPHFDGSSDAKGLPAEFGAEKNLLWSVSLAGNGHGTPVVVGDRIFTTIVDANRKLIAMCLGRADGKVVWQHEMGMGLIRGKGENDVATPSPTTDGKTVVFLFGTGDMAAFDLDGKPIWTRNLQKEVGAWNINWIYGSSPTLYKGKLYVQVLHTDKAYRDTQYPGAAKYEGEVPSYLLALDPATGKQIWKQDRPSDAVQETKESYATPIPHTRADGKDEILLIGGDAVTAHDPETGKEIWRFGGWDPNKQPFWRLIPSVVAGGDFILACVPKGGPVICIRDGGTGDVTGTHKAWQSNGRQMNSDVAVPLFYQGAFFVLGTDSKKLYRVEPSTGDIKWTADLGGSDIFRASPTGADGRIYCVNRRGEAMVVSPEDGKVLYRTSLEGGKGAYSSPAVADGLLLIRVGEKLYAFGKK